MKEEKSIISRAKWVAGLATLILAGASSGVALGNGGYGVTFTGVPKSSVEQGKSLDLRVEATTPVGGPFAYVTVFTSETTACATTIEGEFKLKSENKARDVLGSHVDGKFARQYSFKPERAGTAYLCAYVFKKITGMDTLADATASFPVRPARPNSPAPPSPPHH
jgi:hypothetical protein